ncbi:hypothetical protein T07_174 [Trichinella nelsoni]|uniref:Uncharacterized protein n=1 Tax=Trichinella nelsoni TaxID=6336 RepID=A0A0V0RAS6_9BILA|nr:hypothetical protein T07_174 [Trichinella nelsoni]
MLRESPRSLALAVSYFPAHKRFGYFQGRTRERNLLANI